MILKPILIISGTISLLLGITGLFLPVLPSTPFFLLTAGLYIKGSPALYKKVMSYRLTNRLITRRSGNVSTGSRNLAIIIMWTMITLTAISLADKPVLIALLITTGITGTYLKIRFFKKLKK